HPSGRRAGEHGLGERAGLQPPSPREWLGAGLQVREIAAAANLAAVRLSLPTPSEAFMRRPDCRLFLALTLIANFLAVAQTGSAQEWTRFRGPNGSGVSAATTIPVRWTEKDYNWKVKLPGVGHSSPVLWGERIFVTSGDEQSGKRLVL